MLLSPHTLFAVSFSLGRRAHNTHPSRPLVCTSCILHTAALASTSDEWWDAVTDGLADSMSDVILAALAATNKLFESAGTVSHAALAMRTNARRTALRVCLVMGPMIDTWRMLPSHAQVGDAVSGDCCVPNAQGVAFSSAYAVDFNDVRHRLERVVAVSGRFCRNQLPPPVCPLAHVCRCPSRR